MHVTMCIYYLLLLLCNLSILFIHLFIYLFIDLLIIYLFKFIATVHSTLVRHGLPELLSDEGHEGVP